MSQASLRQLRASLLVLCVRLVGMLHVCANSVGAACYYAIVTNAKDAAYIVDAKSQLYEINMKFDICDILFVKFC